MSGLRIAAIRLLCPDPRKTARFFEQAFDAPSDVADSTVTVTIGEMCVELVQTPAPVAPPQPSNATSFQHFAIVVTDMDAAMQRLGCVTGWTPISRAGPELLPASSGGVMAFKFRDPDGHPLELLAFAQGKMPASWSARSGLFLGVDHTAITVAETDRSIAFYAGLGFTVSSRGSNRGIEQERLDDVATSMVEVTGLTPPGGQPPHLELLCYRQPGPLRAELRDDAVLATRTVMVIEPGPASHGKSADLMDPDGHRLSVG